MKNLRILLAGLLAGLVMSMGVVVGAVEATTDKRVPIGGGSYSANDEGYLELSIRTLPADTSTCTLAQ